MSYSNEELLARANAYAGRNQISLENQLGHGVHGIVFATDRQSAIKIHERPEFYGREVEVYCRLASANVLTVAGFNVPQFLTNDDELLVIEMSIVRPPFMLDFAGAYLDRFPDYPEEVLQETEAKHREQFGNDWPKVRKALRALERYGVYLVDVSPANARVA